MAQISKQDLAKIIQNAPQNKPQDVINYLVGQGHDLEGFPLNLASPEAQQSYLKIKTPQGKGVVQQFEGEQGIEPENPAVQVAGAAIAPSFGLSAGLGGALGLGALPLATKISGEGYRQLGAIAAKNNMSALGIPAFAAGEAVDPQTKLGRIAQLLPLAGSLASAAVRLPEDATTLAQTYKVLGNVPERSTKTVVQALKQGESFPTIDDANEAYAQAIPGLKGATQDLEDRIGKAIPELSDFKKVFNDIVGQAKTPEGITPQDALTGIQSANRILGHKEFSRDAQTLGNILENKNNLIDLLGKAYPEFSEANHNLRLAHAWDDFNSWMPVNRNGSANSLRGFLTMASNVSAATGSLMSGNPAPILGSAALTAAQSPKLLGGLLKARALLGNDLGTLFGGGAEDIAAGAASAAKSGPEPTPAEPTPQSPTPNSPTALTNNSPKLLSMSPDAQLNDYRAKLSDIGQHMNNVSQMFEKGTIGSEDYSSMIKDLHDLKNETFSKAARIMVQQIKEGKSVDGVTFKGKAGTDQLLGSLGQ